MLGRLFNFVIISLFVFVITSSLYGQDKPSVDNNDQIKGKANPLDVTSNTSDGPDGDSGDEDATPNTPDNPDGDPGDEDETPDTPDEPDEGPGNEDEIPDTPDEPDEGPGDEDETPDTPDEPDEGPGDEDETPDTPDSPDKSANGDNVSDDKSSSETGIDDADDIENQDTEEPGQDIEDAIVEDEEVPFDEEDPDAFEEDLDSLEDGDDLVDSEFEEDEAVEDVISIDTLSVEEPSGNWFFKRHWYQKAQSRYGHIGATISKILQSRTELITLNESVQNELLDAFYKDIGFSLGEITAAVNSLLEQLDELRKQKGALNDEQAQLLSVLEDAQEELEQLVLDIEDVSAHDNAFERTMKLVMQQIDTAYEYQNQAFDAVQTIARELNDLAAKAEYLKVRSYARSVKDIQAYLEGDLSTYLTTLAQQLTTLTQQITAEVSQLQSVGVDVKQEVKQLRGDVCASEGIEEEVPAEVIDHDEQGFASRAMRGITNVVRWPLKVLGLVDDESDADQADEESVGIDESNEVAQ